MWIPWDTSHCFPVKPYGHIHPGASPLAAKLGKGHRPPFLQYPGPHPFISSVQNITHSQIIHYPVENLPELSSSRRYKLLAFTAKIKPSRTTSTKSFIVWCTKVIITCINTMCNSLYPVNGYIIQEHILIFTHRHVNTI